MQRGSAGGENQKSAQPAKPCFTHGATHSADEKKKSRISAPCGKYSLGRPHGNTEFPTTNSSQDSRKKISCLTEKFSQSSLKNIPKYSNKYSLLRNNINTSRCTSGRIYISTIILSIAVAPQAYTENIPHPKE